MRNSSCEIWCFVASQLTDKKFQSHMQYFDEPFGSPRTALQKCIQFYISKEAFIPPGLLQERLYAVDVESIFDYGKVLNIYS